MTRSEPKASSCTTFESADFDRLLSSLADDGYEVIGPTARDGVIAYDSVTSSASLPTGYVDELEAGRYRLSKTDQPAFFGYTISADSWKRYLFPPQVRLWTAKNNGAGPSITSDVEGPQPRYAFVGVRPCDVQAIAFLDRVFSNGPYVDPLYKARRDSAFIVAVNCTRPGQTCFCASMGTGPSAASGFDLALTEVVERDRHYFVAEAGSERGAAMLARVPGHATTAEEQKTASKLLQKAAKDMGRSVNRKGLKDLTRNYEHPEWDAVAARCLACGNCTMVCPSCFCTGVEDVTDLTGTHAEHWRKWDSCFSLDFSYIHGGSVRASTKSRYRQWLTHKMATSAEQFDIPACVGCGRCITWCPVGIDVTEEIRALQAAEPGATTRRR